MPEKCHWDSKIPKSNFIYFILFYMVYYIYKTQLCLKTIYICTFYHIVFFLASWVAWWGIFRFSENSKFLGAKNKALHKREKKKREREGETERERESVRRGVCAARSVWSVSCLISIFIPTEEFFYASCILFFLSLSPVGVRARERTSERARAVGKGASVVCFIWRRPRGDFHERVGRALAA